MNKLAAFLLFFLLLTPLGANPFMGGTQENDPDAPRSTSHTTLQMLTDWQLQLRDMISDFFKKLDGGAPHKAMLSIAFVSFLYGIVHAAGPGHRKTIVFSLFLGRKSKWWEPIGVGFYSAALHGFTGLVLILILQALSLGILGARLNRVSIYLEGFTYIALSIAVLILLVLKVLELLGKREHHCSCGADHSSLEAHEHQYHKHESSRKGLYATTTAGSLFPCPGAIMILLFSLAVGKISAGLTALIFMSLGMGMTVSSVGLFARTGREGVFSALKEKQKDFLGGVLEAGAYSFLLLYSLWAVTPFVLSLLS